MNKKLTDAAGKKGGSSSEARLNKARGFLRQGMQVSETAFQVGYQSPAHFSKIFRENFGCSPQEFVSKGKTVWSYRIKKKEEAKQKKTGTGTLIFGSVWYLNFSPAPASQPKIAFNNTFLLKSTFFV